MDVGWTRLVHVPVDSVVSGKAQNNEFQMALGVRGAALSAMLVAITVFGMSSLTTVVVVLVLAVLSYSLITGVHRKKKLRSSLVNSWDWLLNL